jgi:sugar O-acyltransferase (sialic acid O-acetyltransferase NeuD family)
MHRNIVVIGGGGHAKVAIGTLSTLNFLVEVVVDDDETKWGKNIAGVPIKGLGSIIGLDQKRAIIAIGSNRIRKRLALEIRCEKWETIIHPYAFVHPSVSIGEGTVVFAGAVIQPDAVVGKHCIINTNAAIDHDCLIGDYSHVGPGVSLAGNVTVGEGAFLGIGSVAIMGSAIGRWSTVGAGAAVVHNIPDNVTAVGLPARIIKRKQEV